jgi:hypothetical protein
MKTVGSKQVRCAIYTRVSTDQGLQHVPTGVNRDSQGTTKERV